MLVGDRARGYNRVAFPPVCGANLLCTRRAYLAESMRTIG